MAVRFSTSGKILFVALRILFVPLPHGTAGLFVYVQYMHTHTHTHAHLHTCTHTSIGTHTCSYPPIVLVAGLCCCDMAQGIQKQKEKERQRWLEAERLIDCKVPGVERMNVKGWGWKDEGEQMEGNLRRGNWEGMLRRGKGRCAEDGEGVGEKSMGEKIYLKIPCAIDNREQQTKGDLVEYDT